MNEARLCVCRRRRVAAAQRGERQKGERREGVEERSAAPRGSIHHTSGGAIRTWGRGEKKKKGFEVWTSKRLYALFPKNNVGLKQMRSLRCPNKVQNKTKGKERASAAAASTETLEGNNKERRQRHCCPADGPPFGFSSSLWSGEEAFGCWYSTSVKGTTHRIKPDDCRGERHRCHIH